MKKLYSKPVINAIEFDDEIVLTTSGVKADLNSTSVDQLKDNYAVKEINVENIIGFDF